MKITATLTDDVLSTMHDGEAPGENSGVEFEGAFFSPQADFILTIAGDKVSSVCAPRG